MSSNQSLRVMSLLSIVERGKATKLIAKLKQQSIHLHLQCVGMGTAPTEMMDIFGLGSKNKDVVLSFGSEGVIREMMADFGNNFSSYSEFGGLMIMLKPSAINRLAAEIAHHNTPEDTGKGASEMKSEHKHNLIMITVSQGYTDQVMQVARKAGATGGTVIRGRLADTEKLQEAIQAEVEEEREIIFILAPANISRQIMDDVNQEFGLRSEARGILCSVPIEKAYKI